MMRLSWRRIAGLAFTYVLPLALTLFVMTVLVPSRMAGGARGPLATLAWLGDEHPVLLAIGLLTLFTETAKYWRRRWLPTAGGREIGVRFVVVLAALLAATFLVRADVVEVLRVSSSSMVPTLNVGDRLVVDKRAYGLRVPFAGTVGVRTPRRGDVVVFHSQAGWGDDARLLVKRVIGLPGDVVAFRGGSPVINGWFVPSCDAGPFLATAGPQSIRGRIAIEYLEDRTYLTVRTPLDESAFAAYKVKPGELFVMGDDRGLSRDSRVWNDGHGAGVNVADITGRVSRLAVGGHQDGTLDLRSLLAPLGLRVRARGIDLTDTEARLAACLRERPATTWPPTAGSQPVADGTGGVDRALLDRVGQADGPARIEGGHRDEQRGAGQ